MNNSIRVALPAEIDKITDLMDKGFSADPTVTWLQPTQKEFSSLHHRFVELSAKPAFGYGGVHVVSDYSGAAIWYRPGIEFDATGFAKIVEMASLPDRFESFFQLLNACKKFRPTEPYWEFELLAVDPIKHGRGIGSALMEHGLNICDAEGTPVYLESSNAANLSLYRRYGFELLSEVQLPDTPKRFPMLRQAL